MTIVVTSKLTRAMTKVDSCLPSIAVYIRDDRPVRTQGRNESAWHTPRDLHLIYARPLVCDCLFRLHFSYPDTDNGEKIETSLAYDRSSFQSQWYLDRIYAGLLRFNGFPLKIARYRI